MNAYRFAWLCSAVLLAAPACQGKGATPAPATKSAAAATPAPAAADANAGAKAGPAPRQASPATPAPPTPKTAKELGTHLADPGWFRKTMFGDKGNAIDTKRSEADEQGRFSSLIRFELTDMDVAGCADHLQDLVKDELPGIERKDVDGRIQLDGKTDRYTATFMCGEAKGKTIAYVSYNWT